MLILLIRYKLCAVQIRHITSTSEDVQYKQVNHQILVQRDTIQKYFPLDELFLLVYQVKWLVAYGRLQKSIKYEIS